MPFLKAFHNGEPYLPFLNSIKKNKEWYISTFCEACPLLASMDGEYIYSSCTK